MFSIQNIYDVKADPELVGTAYAVLTNAGELILFRSTETYTYGVGKTVRDIKGNSYKGRVYTGIETTNLDESYNSSWYYQKISIKSVRVANGQTIKPVNCGYWFDGCSNCTSMDLTGLDTAKVKTMNYMFYGCSRLTTLVVSSFNTGNVTNMSNMFTSCSGLTALDLRSFDTGNVTRMSSMFYECSGLTAFDLSNFNTGNVTRMGNMFEGCSQLSSVILGQDFSFKGKNISITSDQAILPTPPSDTMFTGDWIKEDKIIHLRPTKMYGLVSCRQPVFSIRIT